MTTLAIDVGQSGTRFYHEGTKFELPIAHSSGSKLDETLKSLYESLGAFKCETVVMSLTGLNGKIRGTTVFLDLSKRYVNAKRVLIMDDGIAGHFAVHKGEGGVTLIAGSGVVCIASKGNHFVHMDGLGSIFGDEGSGYWLGSRLLARALAAREHRDDQVILIKELNREIEKFDALESKNGAQASKLAIECGQRLLELADRQIPLAMDIRDLGATCLANTAKSAWNSVAGINEEPLNFALLGGLSRNSSYTEIVFKKLLSINSKSICKVHSVDNLDGALWAAENIDFDIEPLLIWAT
jgi:N-acetylglucosamine kinase-like BadF-type ATPase